MATLTIVIAHEKAHRLLISQALPTPPSHTTPSPPPSRDHHASKPLYLLFLGEPLCTCPPHKLPTLASRGAASGSANSHPHLLAAPCNHALTPVWKMTCSRVWIPPWTLRS